MHPNACPSATGKNKRFLGHFQPYFWVYFWVCFRDIFGVQNASSWAVYRTRP
ncbi:hypothetical protein ETAA8_57970 [Anatilimnocola aggregata]|uniref:Uncharacterized protein n=1 Tax=Anatilimnocola aggregata TaxID=2528021 RepID=A0A517YKB1_9BACT|nr:hypothetical protein ETAA8_57970 [Anatilimnocola aggregata]